MTLNAGVRAGGILGAALALAVTACDVGQSDPVSDGDEAYSVTLPTLFDHPGFGGDSFTIDRTTDFVGWDWNDRISAVLVPDGVTLVLYQHAGFGGNRLELVAPGVVNLGDFGFNEEVSSIEVHGLAKACGVVDSPYETRCEGDIAVHCRGLVCPCELFYFDCASLGSYTCSFFEGPGYEYGDQPGYAECGFIP